VKCKTKIYTLFCSQKEKGMGALKWNYKKFTTLNPKQNQSTQISK
jgi:hypothetical protein